MLTAKQHELLRFIQRKLEETGISPSFEEMKDALDVLREPENVAAERKSSALPDNVVRMPTAPRAAPSPANDIIELPLHGRIAAGMPIEALEGQSTLPVPAALLGAGEHYALEVSGDSMVDEGILDGDYALIRKTDIARDGEIVVALINDDEATLKTYRKEG